MKVLKRNGNLQDFNLDKIKTTLICTAEDLKEPLNSSDLNNLLSEINKAINRYKDPISYKDVHNTVTCTLKDMGFLDMSRAYDEFQLSFVNK